MGAQDPVGVDHRVEAFAAQQGGQGGHVAHAAAGQGHHPVHARGPGHQGRERPLGHQGDPAVAAAGGQGGAGQGLHQQAEVAEGAEADDEDLAHGSFRDGVRP